MKRKVIIDCDPGIDDALALILAINSPELDILGITIASGNVNSKIGFINAKKILHLTGREDINVYIGEEVPLVRKLITAEDTHGIDGLGESNYKTTNENEKIVSEPVYGGVEFILEKAKYDEVSIIALGPLTNLATALNRDKDAFNKIKEIVSMGGTFKSHGNCSQVAEFNYWVDPHAVKEIFENSKVKFTMVGLDVTREIVLSPNYIELIKQIGGEVSEFILAITRFYIDFHWKQEKTLGCVINDPLAVAYFIDNSLCTGITSYLDIVTEGVAIGQTLVDIGDFYKKTHNVKVLTEVDSKRFMKFFLGRIFKDNIRDIEIVLNNNRYGL